MMLRATAGTTAADLPAVDAIQTISFVYLGDLIDVILAGIGEVLEEMPKEIANEKGKVGDNWQREVTNYKRYLENFKRYRVVLGPIELTNASKGGKVIDSKFISIGDIPISMRYFLEWMTNKMLKKEEVIYPLPKFLNDLINELLRNFLNNDECFNNEARQSTRLAQSALTAYNTEAGGKDELTERILDQTINAGGLPSVPRRLRMSLVKPEDTPVLSVNGNRENAISNPGKDKETNYMVYYASRVQPVELMKGNYDEDHARGIWHYGIGRDRGIVKTVRLKKTNSPGLKEVRFEQEGYDGLRQLREMYDATIECYSDVAAFPGNYIYVQPGSFSPLAASQGTQLTQFGIGGYYMIIRSEHSFGPGKADTTITAKWVAEVEGEAARVANSEAEPESNKCDSNSDSRTGRQESAANSMMDKIGGWFGVSTSTTTTP